MSTLTFPSPLPSPSEDCEQLHKAFEGWGTNEGLIISVLAHRPAAHRREIRRAYAEIYGEDLLKPLDKELTRDFERAVLLWVLDAAERDAVLANEVVRKWSPGNRVLIEIAVVRKTEELLAAKRAYQVRFKRCLEEDVAAHTRDEYRKLLVPLVSTYRYEGAEVDKSLSKSEAKILHQKIKDNDYSHEDVIRILTTRSKAQLLATFNDYHNEFGNPINKDLKADPKNEFLSALRAIIRCIICPERYLEKVIRLAISKTGTDEGALSRIITTRAEVDMKQIKDLYYKRNSVALDSAVKKDTSGDFEDFLLALIGHEGA
ncbi:annexin Gh1-like [Musa acuminata AAA Group]|uniref:annexin Gh1-like n=1 Tax=Musa acuminata AAA Group TaxID=214697 RepID=UPI0031D52C61